MTDILNPNSDPNPNQYRLYSLTVVDAARAQLISGIDRFKLDCESEIQADDDDATGAIALVLCAVFLAPFVCGFLWGF